MNGGRNLTGRVGSVQKVDTGCTGSQVATPMLVISAFQCFSLVSGIINEIYREHI